MGTDYKRIMEQNRKRAGSDVVNSHKKQLKEIQVRSSLSLLKKKFVQKLEEDQPMELQDKSLRIQGTSAEENITGNISLRNEVEKEAKFSIPYFTSKKWMKYLSRMKQEMNELEDIWLLNSWEILGLSLGKVTEF